MKITAGNSLIDRMTEAMFETFIVAYQYVLDKIKRKPEVFVKHYVFNGKVVWKIYL